MYPNHPGGHDGQRPVPTQQHFGAGQRAASASALTTFVTYAKELLELDSERYPDEYAAHSDRIRQIEPMLRVHGILDVMQIRDPKIAALLEK
ncbi:hypothetical protein ACWEVD_27620 [Nocardia thailandica]|uniref:Uncharacterized protein n=1 Tax=Nocardia thailandica TaxID=257275 RepID=A0ABW6PXX9_9NOCA|nr:hypothetical protein [Nocardia thailandica]